MNTKKKLLMITFMIMYGAFNVDETHKVLLVDLVFLVLNETSHTN